MEHAHASLPACRLLWSGRAELDAGWRFPLHAPFWRLYRNLDDGAVIRHQGGDVAVAAGVPLAIPPWTRAQTSCRGRVRHAWLHFDCPALVRPDDEDPRPVPLAPHPEWEPLLAALPLRATAAPAAALRLQGLLSTALAEALERMGGAPAPAPEAAQARQRVEQALLRIDADPGHPLDATVLARLCGLTRAHFTRLFHRATGMGPAGWQRERRIRHAAHRLALEQVPIADLAVELGFADRYHFTRVFTRVLGLSPAAYRRSCRGA